MNNSIIALDIGEKRIGVAITSKAALFPTPLITLEASEHLATEFAALLSKHRVDTVVIGHPRNQSGETTQQTERVKRIAQLLNIPETVTVHWQDESLTSVKAEEELKRRKKPYAKAAVDSLAATYILEDFIRSNAPLINTSPEATPEQHVSRKHPKKQKKPLALKLLAIVFTVVCVTTAGLAAWYKNSITALAAEDNYTVVSIKSGAGTTQIAKQLQDQKVIKNAQAFSLYTKINRVKNLQAGEYRLSSKQSVADIVAIIASGKVTTVNILISPGLRLDQILTALEKDGYSKAELTTALSAVRSHPLVKDLPANVPLEGYLFPDTYQISPNTTAQQLLTIMLDNLQKKITPQIAAQIKAQGLTVSDAIILASIVQKEVKDPSVQPTVAQVFLKRYKEGIMLGSDVTYMYIEAKTGKQVGPSLDSPYNTRKYSGLPPSAISNFNFSALEAVANPSKTDYLFFVAGDNGTTYFSKTLEEHESLVKKHCTKLCN